MHKKQVYKFLFPSKKITSIDMRHCVSVYTGRSDIYAVTYPWILTLNIKWVNSHFLHSMFTIQALSEVSLLTCPYALFTFLVLLLLLFYNHQDLGEWIILRRNGRSAISILEEREPAKVGSMVLTR